MPDEEEQERIYAKVMLQTRVAKVNMIRQDDYEFQADDVEARVHNEYIIIERKNTDTMMAIIPAANVMIVEMETREYEATVEVDADGNQIGVPEDVPEAPVDMKRHLCKTCAEDFPGCNAKNPKFGTGVGNDNVYECADYTRDDMPSEPVEVKASN